MYTCLYVYMLFRESGTFSCFSSLILCSFALGIRRKIGPDLSSSLFRLLPTGFFPAAPWQRRQSEFQAVWPKQCDLSYVIQCCPVLSLHCSCCWHGCGEKVTVHTVQRVSRNVTGDLPNRSQCRLTHQHSAEITDVRLLTHSCSG